MSQLQEFIQGARAFAMPPSCPVLHWCHDTRKMGKSGEFRATVSFLLDGVPHHTIGTWMPSKKAAQRDVAERVLDLFVSQWGEFLDTGSDVSDDAEDDADGTGNARTQGPVQDLEMYCANLASEVAGSVQPRWSCVNDGDCYQAFVEIVLFGIPHTFPGKHSGSQDDACNDTARRVLWYF